MIDVSLVHSGAILPNRGSPAAAGYDLYACSGTIIEAGERRLVDTGIKLDMSKNRFPPELEALGVGIYGRIAPRSGLALRNGIQVGAGVIDPDYRGNLGVLVFNFGKEVFHVQAGDRIAQLIFEVHMTPELRVVAGLSDTTRGDGGFGSTGK